MKRILVILTLSLLCSISLFSRNKSPDSLRTEVEKLKQQYESLEQRLNDSQESQQSILEIKNEIAESKLNTADSKQAFYDSHINKLNLIFTITGLIIAILGYFGYRSISGGLRDIKNQVDKEIESLENRRSELKNDINNRINDIKTELRDFKIEQKEEYSKFQFSANERIKEGLDLQLEKAIDKIIKGSLGVQIDNLNEQFAELNSAIEKIKSESSKFASTDSKQSDDVNPRTSTGTQKTNAFENGPQ